MSARQTDQARPQQLGKRPSHRIDGQKLIALPP